MTCRNWPASLAPASFKGVGFEVDGDTRNAGRRIVTHEYPASEFWDNEDLGRKASTIQVTGYVCGDDADAKSQRLLLACSIPGPGLLVLPARPPLMVRAVQCTSTFAADRLGRIAIELEFAVEAAGIGGMAILSLVAGKAMAAIDEALKIVATHFDAQFNSVLRRFSPLQPVPALARFAAAKAIAEAARLLTTVRRRMVTVDYKSETVVARLARRIEDNADKYAVQGQRPKRDDEAVYVDTQADLVSPFARELMEAVAALAEVPANPAEAWRALDLLTAFKPERTANTVDTLSVRAENGLVDEVGAFVRRASLLLQARIMVQGGFPSRKTGLAARAAMAQGFEAEIAAAGAITIELALTAARAAMADYLTKALIDRKSVTVTHNTSLPALVIATRLYNDAGRDGELMARNHAPHPSFMPLVVTADRS